jgi:hypothetical protein
MPEPADLEPKEKQRARGHLFSPQAAWSHDGKKFAITRARYNDTDVVIFSGFR